MSDSEEWSLSGEAAAGGTKPRAPSTTAWPRPATTAVPWRRWGPYLSERQWGTVREDYSDDGDAWDYFSHDQARSRAYRWGEDGLAGISDDQPAAVLRARAVERPRPDPQGAAVRPHQPRGQPRRGRQGVLLLPRRHADPLVPALPLQVPAGGVPVRRPGRDQRAPRSRTEFEYELLDTGVFDDDRYFDVDVEYAKAAPDDIAIRITVTNRGPGAATLHLLPTLWFRNTWSWGDDDRAAVARGGRATADTVVATHPDARQLSACAARAPTELLFTENETNPERLVGHAEPDRRTSRTGSTSYVVHGRRRRGQPGAGRAPRRRRTTRSTIARRGDGQSSGCDSRRTCRRRDGRAVRRRVRRGHRAAAPRGGRRSTRRSSRATLDRG